MRRNQKGFTHFGLLFLAVVLVAIFLIGLTVLHKNKGVQSSARDGNQISVNGAYQEGTGPNYKALATCGDRPFFGTVPIDTSAFYQIIPLGNLNVPDHAIPTDHLYFAYNHPGDMAPIKAPGAIVVTSINYVSSTVSGVTHQDYSINFFACKGVAFDFAHIGQLSGALADAVAGNSWDQPCAMHSQANGEENTYCTKTTDIAVAEGSPLGIAGGPGKGAFDFGAHSASYVSKQLTTPSMYTGGYANATCALDYFGSTSKTKLYTLIKRSEEPRCGQVAQDKTGTAQGAWFATQDSQKAMNDWNTQLSLVPSNLNPGVISLAVAGTISDPSLFFFTPKTTGTTNRAPADITPGAAIYCFQSEPQPQSSYLTDTGSGRFIVQLVDNKTLKVEHKAGICTAAETFSSPTTYYR